MSHSRRRARLVVDGETGALQRADGAHLARLHAVLVGDGGDRFEQVGPEGKAGDDPAPPRELT